MPDDRTGLYDTILAAFRHMNRMYRPGVVNSVLVFTDGPDDDPAGISLENLLTTIRDEYDPAKPVHVAVFGFGGGVDRGAVGQIAEATGGNVQIIDNLDHVGDAVIAPTIPSG